MTESAQTSKDAQITKSAVEAGSGRSAAPAAGVDFARERDQRPTTAPLRRVLAEAARAGSRELGGRLERCGDWRTEYAPLLAELTGLAATDRETAWAIADAGLGEARRSLVWTAGRGEVPLREVAAEDWASPPPETGEIRGTGDREKVLRVPYRGEVLEGQALLERLDGWVSAGTVEPSFAEAIARVVEHPEWLSLPGETVATIGAGGELSPLAPLTRWGADVLAVDLPTGGVAERIRRIAERGAGRVRYPLASDGTPGADVVADPAAAHAWIDGRVAESAGHGDNLVFGMYAYADRGSHVRISMATDLIAERLLDSHPSTALAYLQTPTDAFVVPPEVVRAGHDAWGARDAKRFLQGPLRMAGRGTLFEPSYKSVHADGTAVADILVPQQGPSYAVAKRLQRWRGIDAERGGHTVSFNVAPASWTRSVTKNRVLASAYKGARRFGVEIFDADTTRVLMAALMAHDVMNGPTERSHPEQLFADQAAHGGLWRSAYEPKTVLGFAAIMGMAGL